MSDQVNLYEAKTQLSRLVERASAGEIIVIAKAGKPMSRLVPIETPSRAPGQWRGQIEMAPEFDDPLPDEILSVLEGRG